MNNMCVCETQMPLAATKSNEGKNLYVLHFGLLQGHVTTGLVTLCLSKLLLHFIYKGGGIIERWMKDPDLSGWGIKRIEHHHCVTINRVN